MKTLYDEYNYQGDVSLEHGGAFFDLSPWKDGYVLVVQVTDLDSGCGFTGAVLVEHLVVLLDRKYDSTQRSGDHWKDALSCIGMSAADLLEYDLWGKRMAIAYALLSYGRYDPDDSWDNYQTHWSTTIQCEHNGLGSYDGWKATVFLGKEGCELEEYVLQHHVTDTGFCVPDKGMPSV